MKKLLKLVIVFMCMSFVLTACSSDDNKVKKAKNKPIEQVGSSTNNDVKDESVNKEEDSNDSNKVAKNKVVSNESNKLTLEKLEKDKEEITRLVNDIISISMNSFDIDSLKEKRTDKGILYSTFSVVNYESKSIRKLESKNNPIIFIVKLSDFVDIYNKYNKGTYNEDYVLDDILRRINFDINSKTSSNFKIDLEIYDEKATDKTDEELKELLKREANFNYKIVYFKGDKTFAYTLLGGLGGVDAPEAVQDVSKWEINGDTIVIPKESIVIKNGKFTKGDIVEKVTIKVNNKNYTGGSNRSKYYLYDIEYL